MHLIKRFLAGYTDNFVAALTLWPAASLVLTLPILAYLYHRDGRLKFVSIVSTYLAVLYIMGLACFTLYPLPDGSTGLGFTYGVPWQLDPLAPLDDFRREGVAVLPQIAFNVVFFMPLGFIAGRLLRWKFLPSVFVGMLTSCLIELAQGTGVFGIYAYAYRTADVDDVIYNTLGAALGWCCAALLSAVFPPGALADEDDITYTPGVIRRGVAFWLDTLLVSLITMVVCGAISLALRKTPGLEHLADGSWSTVVPFVVFALVECLIPALRDGSTPGGGFVRMSCETKRRTGIHRAVFYLVRLVVLGAAWFYYPIALPVLALFCLIARRMPYDLL